MMLLFYGKAIVEYENWMSKSIHFFTKGRIGSLFDKMDYFSNDQDIAEEKLSRFPTSQILSESAKPLHDTTNKIYGGKE